MRLFRRKEMEAATAAGEEAEQPAGENVDVLARYDTHSENRRLLWVLRTVAVVAVFLGMVVLAQGLAIFALLPLKETVPVLLVTSDKDDQIVRVAPFERGTPGFALMSEFLVRQYVEIAHTVVPSHEAMRERWGRHMHSLSSDAVFRDMQRNFAEPSQRLVDAGHARGVEIHGDPRLFDRQGAALFYQVSFDTIDTHGTQELARLGWVATLRVEYLPRQFSAADRYINPLGFVVTAYTVARAGVRGGDAR